jgi:hypothetical protein
MTYDVVCRVAGRQAGVMCQHSSQEYVLSVCVGSEAWCAGVSVALGCA